MAEDSAGHIHLSVESPFIKYFDRCQEIGMTKSEIQKNFKYLDKYYGEMVTDKLSVETSYKLNPTLDKLFNEWCCDNNMK